MNEQDYIKKAVELADGWGYSETYPDQWVTWPQSSNFPFSLFPQVSKDALAAQLVRQVDALDTPDTVEVLHNKVWVGYRSKISESWKLTKGTDRTMNTIRAIVDSGVLVELTDSKQRDSYGK